MPPTQNQDGSSSVFASVVSGQLDQERARKAAIEGRALTIIQASAGFLTIFGTVTIAQSGSMAPVLGPPALWFVGLAVAFFLFAATASIFTWWHSGVGSYGELLTRDLATWSENRATWDAEDPVEAAQTVALAQIRALTTLRDRNEDAAAHLKSALLLECLAVTWLLVAAVLLLAPKVPAASAPLTPTPTTALGPTISSDLSTFPVLLLLVMVAVIIGIVGVILIPPRLKLIPLGGAKRLEAETARLRVRDAEEQRRESLRAERDWLWKSDTKLIVDRWFNEFWSAGKASVADEIIAPTYAVHDLGNPERRGGVDGEKEVMTRYRGVFPDLQVQRDDVLATGDWTVVRWTARGTQQGILREIVPTGKQVTVSGISLIRIRDGKIVEHWVNWDAVGMFQQLDPFPAPGVAGQ